MPPPGSVYTSYTSSVSDDDGPVTTVWFSWLDCHTSPNLGAMPSAPAARARSTRNTAADNRCARVDLAMARHDRSCALGADPPSVVSALVHLTAVISAEMTLQIASLHAAIVRCSASRSRRSPASLGSGESISRSASMTFVRASSRVRPWLNTPATSGIDAMIQPSSPGS